MTDSLFIWSNRIVHSFPARVILVILTTAVIACTCTLLFLINRSVSPSLLRIVAILLVGLSGGFSATALLSNYLTTIKYLAAFISTTTGLMLLYTLTKGYAGIPMQTSLSIFTDSIRLSQLTAGLLAAGLATFAWKPISNRQAKPANKLKQPSKKRPKAKLVKGKQVQKPIIKRQSTIPSRQATYQARVMKIRWAWKKQLDVLKIKTNNSFAKYNIKLSRWLRKVSTRTYTRNQMGHSIIQLQRARHKHRMALRKNTAIKLVGKAENRCPYCLEIVQPDDPRGIKICPECNTYHHADCWAVTGHCQVPHYQE